VARTIVSFAEKRRAANPGGGFLLGAGFAALYLFVIWSARANLDHISRPIALVIFIPLALFIGPFWATDRLASRIDKRQLTN